MTDPNTKTRLPKPPASWQQLPDANSIERLAFVLGPSVNVEIDPKYDVMVCATDAATYWAERLEVTA